MIIFFVSLFTYKQYSWRNVQPAHTPQVGMELDFSQHTLTLCHITLITVDVHQHKQLDHTDDDSRKACAIVVHQL